MVDGFKSRLVSDLNGGSDIFGMVLVALGREKGWKRAVRNSAASAASFRGHCGWGFQYFERGVKGLGEMLAHGFCGFERVAVAACMEDAQVFLDGLGLEVCAGRVDGFADGLDEGVIAADVAGEAWVTRCEGEGGVEFTVFGPAEVGASLGGEFGEIHEESFHGFQWDP